jgi:transcriptional regulator with XRE-family HTH domain
MVRVLAPIPDLERAAVVAKAFIRAGEKLKLTNRELAEIVGLSEASVSRVRSGDAKLLTNNKPRELATLFLRLYRSLDAIVGGDDMVSARWMRNANTALGGAPIDLIASAQGLVRVTDYLDSRRAVV